MKDDIFPEIEKDLQNSFLKIPSSMPKTFKDLGIENPDVEKLVDIITDNGEKVIKHPKKDMDKEVLTAIFNSCR